LPYTGCTVDTPLGNSYSCGLTQDGTPDCDRVVTSITPTNPVQKVYVGDNIISTVIASYLNGSTKTIIANVNGYDKNKLESQIVTLSYTGLVNNAKTVGTKTCAITVTVIPKTKTCSNGHTYNLKADGTDPGCPYCKAWLRSLIVKEPATGTIAIFRGTTLKQNGVTLQATYMNGSTELVTDTYIDNLDKTYVGTQNVTLSYKGQYTHMTVSVKKNIVKCIVCGRYYELFPDDTDPGCPYCAARTPVFTGNIMEYYDRKYTDDILKELYHGSEIYYFARDDYFIIKLQNSSRSLGGKLTAAFYQSLADGNIRTQDGGYIRQRGQ
jgi:glutaredoxin